MNRKKYEHLGVKNSHQWLLVEYSGKSDEILKQVYSSITNTLDYLVNHKDEFEPDKLMIMYDNLECLHYGICTFLGVSLDQQIKMAKGFENEN